MIRKKEFATATLDLDDRVFIIHIVSIIRASLDLMYPFYKAQIALLKSDKAPTAIPSKYTDFADVFFADLAVELLEDTGINDYTIELIIKK